MNWQYKEIKISEVKDLISDYEIEVDSPDGYVPITDYINKGEWDEYVLVTDNGKLVRVNENHLFETTEGWKLTKDLIDKAHLYITDEGISYGRVIKTGKKIPIVDIQVDHDNHRYYTNGVSSHNTGVGKSLFMCHCAAANLSLGKNVLYITLEMSEEKIAERIDANLMDVTMDELHNMSQSNFVKTINKIKDKTTGKLIIKEYPTAAASASNFRALINDLKIKKNFIPDIIYIDYLNICASSRVKPGSNINSYAYVKAIAEEIRGLAIEFDLPVVTATQTNRSGFSNSEVELTDTSECIMIGQKVTLKDNSIKKIEDVIPGDQIISNDGYKTCMFIHHKKIKDCVEIKLKSGKSIIVSKDHVFPSSSGRLSINTGLKEGIKLLSQTS